MTHEDAGKYSAKHPAGTGYDEKIAAMLAERSEEGRLTCTAAHEVAALTGAAPSEIGKTADLLEYRIVECQMGLFGYSPSKRIVRPDCQVSEELRQRLQGGSKEGRISCALCWKIAEDLGLSRLDVGCGCEALGLKVKPCQLGAF